MRATAYSAGSWLPMPAEVILREKLKAGAALGPRLLADSVERDNHPARPDGHTEPDWQGPETCASWVREQAAADYDSVKFLLSNDDVFTSGGSQITQHSAAETGAAGAQAALDLLESVKDSVFVSPAPVINYANVYEGEEFDITTAVAESMGSVAALEGMARIYPEIRKRDIRALHGGDHLAWTTTYLELERNNLTSHGCNLLTSSIRGAVSDWFDGAALFAHAIEVHQPPAGFARSCPRGER